MANKKTITKYLNVDARFNSEYCYFPFSDYYIELPEKIYDVKTLTVICIEVPITYYNVCDVFNNNCFKVTTVVDEKTKDYKSTIIKIPDNNYTIETLHDAISEALKQNSIDDLTFSVSKHSRTKAASQTHNYLLDFAIDNKGNTDMDNLNTKLGWMLGFRTINSYIKPENETCDENQTICSMYNPRYLYLEILEYEDGKRDDNNYLFSSSLLGCHISKYIIARITLDYKTFPFGSTLPANLVNGLLVSNIRQFHKPKKIRDMKIRILNEFGMPICFNGFEISFCLHFECEERCDN